MDRGQWQEIGKVAFEDQGTKVRIYSESKRKPLESFEKRNDMIEFTFL